MIKLIKNATIYSPKYLGKKDILIANSKVAAIEDHIILDSELVEVIDAENKLIFPGFIDSHVHLLGGGGEGSYRTSRLHNIYSPTV